MNHVIQLSDISYPSREIMSFMWHYDNEIRKILTGEMSTDIKERMSTDFDKLVEKYPSEIRALADIYQMLQRRYERYSYEMMQERKVCNGE